MRIKWSDEKNDLLRQSRKVCFEDIENAIMTDNIVDIIPHHNIEKYPNQELMIVYLKNYTYYVPFVINDEEIFLKNIIPSRKLHKRYSKNDKG